MPTPDIYDEIIAAVPCPFCGEPIGERCVEGATGRERLAPHVIRWRDYQLRESRPKPERKPDADA